MVLGGEGKVGVLWEGANRTMEGVREWKLSCRGENEREGLKG